MKQIVEEIKSLDGRKIKVEIYDDENKILNSYLIHYTVKSVVIEDYTYVLLFDKVMNCVEKAYYFLNKKLRYKAINTRLLYASIIKNLYEFSDIKRKNVDELDYLDFLDFQDFLYGYKRNSNFNYYYFFSSRSKNVVNKYLSVCINFMKTSGYKNYKLVEKVMIDESSRGYINHSCPKYISYDEMKRIVQFVRKDISLSEETRKKYESVFRLMYESGLRIGEVLGLTVEDLKLIDTQNNKKICLIKIRNRVSDGSKQLSKTCMNVIDKNQYHSRDYGVRNVGFQECIISTELYDLIFNYFDAVCLRLTELEKTPPIADSVESDDKNYYIFMNSNNEKCLNYRVLCTYTREMFTRLSIHVDEYTRYNNLFHRFRHGYIMYLLYVKHLPEAVVIKYSRHKSARSLMPYNNPSDELLSSFLEEMEYAYEHE